MLESFAAAAAVAVAIEVRRSGRCRDEAGGIVASGAAAAAMAAR